MTSTTAKWTRFRLGLVFTFFVIAWAGILYKAFVLQILEREHLAKIAEREGQKTMKIRPIRGEIYDRNGEKLAVSLEMESIFADPKMMKDQEAVATQLAKVLKMSRKNLLNKLNKKDSFVWIKRKVDPKTAGRVADLNMKGVGFLKESKRFYPNNMLASHVLGFAGVDSQGLEGVELGLEEHLRGDINQCQVKRDALGRMFLDLGTTVPEKNRGRSVRLTIDRRIQYVAETALEKAVDEHKAKNGMALVVDPKTGEILASAVYPSFNPNVFGTYPAERRRNRIITDTFDPGSTFKVFVVAAALEDGLVKPTDKIFCENGAMKIGPNTIHDHHEYGWLTVNSVIQKSSNIGTVKISNKLGPARMYSYLQGFSFGRKTGIDFPGESAGLVRPYKQWRQIDAANVAFGQGVTVTALQMTMAMAAIANDGMLMKPRLVSAILDDHGRLVRTTKPYPVRRVISEETAGMVKKMLRMVVTEGGTGTMADSPGYPAAGKTGTAQKIDPRTRRYSNKKYFSSFLGYVPYDNPRLAIFVGLDEPKSVTYGGVVAAPVFREIAEQVLPLLNVPPVNENGAPDEPNSQTPQKDHDTELLSAKAQLSRPGRMNALSVKVEMDSKTAVQSLAEKIREEEQYFLSGGMDAGPMMTGCQATTAAKFEVMPDLVGLSMRRVLDVMSKYPVDCNFSGSGLAVWQKPEPGKPLKSGQVCKIKFEQR